MLTRRSIILSGAATLAIRRVRAQSAPVYALPPQSLGIVRDDGAHTLSSAVQRDRNIGTKTRPYTATGTVVDFSRVRDSSNVSYAKFDATTYANLVAAAPTIFNDCALSNSIVGEKPEFTATVDERNPGTHPQVCLMIGDSLMNSTTGGTPSNGLLQAANWCWTQPIVSKGAAYATQAIGMGVDFEPEAWFTDPMLPFARLCLNWGRPGWRLGNVPGVTYPSFGGGGGWSQQVNYLRDVVLAPGQKLDAVIQAGTNDLHSDGNVAVWGSPTQGSPNLAANCLVPLVNLLRAQLPIHRIGVMTPIARDEGTCCGSKSVHNNQAFSDYADWVLANAPTIGIDAIWDSRTDPALDCRNWQAVTADTTVYQTDKTHLTANGYVNHLGPGATALLDAFWNS